MSRRGDLDAKVYIGGLPHDATSQEIEDTFHRFGRIRKVWVARRPPGFAFVEFEDTRDAEDAVKSLDGARICGVRARVELSHGRALAVAHPHVVEHRDRVLQMTEGASAEAAVAHHKKLGFKMIHWSDLLSDFSTLSHFRVL
ncbi:hypothetical protein OSTOST_03877 [Ostertagia ostertagi]